MKKATGILCAALTVSMLGGCVNQHPNTSRDASADTTREAVEDQTDTTKGATSNQTGQTKDTDSDKDVLTRLDPGDKAEQQAVAAAKKKAASVKDIKIVATSPAVADICDRLDLDLAGVCSSAVSEIPKRYKDAADIGIAMSPDMEVISSLNPDWILSPSSLQSDLQPKYEAIRTDWAFLNLRSVPGMYTSIEELGEIFGKEKQAEALVDDYTAFCKKYEKKNKDRKKPKVMILMGLPGSYVIATKNSYVGSLVEMAGGENVYDDKEKEYLNVNTEDMKTKEPDVILRACHALPDQAIKMFDEDFKTNDVWKHFAAVENDRVYDLSYANFGMSATFAYPDALAELQPALYQESDADGRKARANSDAAAKAAAASDATDKTDADDLAKAKAAGA